MEKYIKLKEKCDASYCDMGETERLLKAMVKKMDEAYQSGSLRELKNVLPALQRLESRAKGSYAKVIWQMRAAGKLLNNGSHNISRMQEYLILRKQELMI